MYKQRKQVVLKASTLNSFRGLSPR